MEAPVMKWLLLTVVAATLAATAEAKVVPGCCSNGKWRAKYFVSKPYSTPSDAYTETFHVDYTYDAPNQRTAKMKTTNSGKKLLKVINLYQKRESYSYDLNTGLCHKSPLLDVFQKLCTSDVSKVIRSNITAKIGKRLVNATRLYFETQELNGDGLNMILVKNDDCVTLSTVRVIAGPASTKTINKVMTELNEELWCEDDFKIPEACKGQSLKLGRPETPPSLLRQVGLP